MSSSDLSSLSSVPPSDDEADQAVERSLSRKVGLEKYFKMQTAKELSPELPPREKSPPHEYVLADNENIPFIVMFRSRFSSAFPRSLPHYGPQDIEKGVSEPIPADHIERLLCALLGLVLNRKKDIEKGHFSRALEEAIAAHVSQWPRAWEGKNPLRGGRSFTTMTAEERLVLLRALILWSLSSSDTISRIIKESYKQARHDDDLNQPLSVQPWGRDAYKRRYWLIEGQDDTHFRVYRESKAELKNNTWWSIAGNIEEVKKVADGLERDTSQNAKRLREQIRNAIPRFEASEEKRKRRDYRLARKAQFARPEPGFSLYEGRTRGKRLKYTFSDDEDDTSDAVSARRSTRQSGVSTPAEPAGPTFTASGRQVKTRQGGAYGESMLSGQRKTGSSLMNDAPTADADSDAQTSTGHPQRNTRNTRSKLSNGWRKGDDHIEDYNSVDEMDEEDDAASSGDDWEGDDDENQDFAGDDEEEDDEDDDMSRSEEEELEEKRPKKQLVVQLQYRKGHGSNGDAAPSENDDQAGNSPSSQSATSMPRAMDTTPPNPSPPLKPLPVQAAQPNYSIFHNNVAFNGQAESPSQLMLPNGNGGPSFDRPLPSHSITSPERKAISSSGSALPGPDLRKAVN